MLRIPVKKPCAFNFRVEFYFNSNSNFNFGLNLPCVIYAALAKHHASDNAKFGTT